MHQPLFIHARSDSILFPINGKIASEFVMNSQIDIECCWIRKHFLTSQQAFQVD